MDIRFILLLFAFIYLITITFVFSAPVDPIKKTDDNHNKEELNANQVEKNVEKEVDDMGLEYGRYLQQIVEALEQDKEFAKKLENVTQDEIKSGAIARELEFVNHNVRTRLDELKRIEMDRLRRLARKEHELEEYQNSNGNQEGIYDSRRWRTLGDTEHKLIDPEIAGHLDHKNPHSFEAEDLHRLIQKATKDLEELDQKRREDFKQYEMEKELEYRENLQNMTKEQREETEKKRHEMEAKHKQHEKLNHPGSKKQLEQVWEQQDHMPREEFNPKVFFTMHDINGDGFLDPQEVEAILTLEIRKVYSDKNPEDDRNEMEEEYHRMREHIYKEADTNRDGLISKKEFLDFTHRMEFEKDEGWKGLDETQVYDENDLKQYQEHRQQLQNQNQRYGTYDQQFAPQYYPQGFQPQHYPQQYYPNQQHPQQYYPQQQIHPQQDLHPNQYYGNEHQINPQIHPNAQQLHPEQQQALYLQQQQALHHAQQQQALHHAQQQQQYQQHVQQQQQNVPQVQHVPQQQYQQQVPQHVPQQVPQQLPQHVQQQVPQHVQQQQHVQQPNVQQIPQNPQTGQQLGAQQPIGVGSQQQIPLNQANPSQQKPNIVHN